MFARIIQRKYSIMVMRTGQLITTSVKQMSGNAYNKTPAVMMKINRRTDLLMSPVNFR